MAKKSKVSIELLDPAIPSDFAEKLEKGEEVVLGNVTPLVKNIMDTLHKARPAERIVFDEDPNTPNKFAGLYYEKFGLLPDILLKRLAITDDLVATILNLRSNHASPFGRKLESRHSNGFRIEPQNLHDFHSLPDEKKKTLNAKIKKAADMLFTCGKTEGWEKDKLMTLPKFLHLSARNALLFGRFGAELIYSEELNGKKVFNSFRPIDVGTIYRALPESPGSQAIREQGLRMLADLKNERIQVEKAQNDEYTWFQVIQGKPVNAFTSDEVIIHDCYPSTDIELNGYPITPIDTAIQVITTHINITNHNKLYFQNGRASKGMLVINSDSVDPSTLADLKQHFNAAINSVANSWRMPLIKVSKDDNVQWQAIDSGSRDMEFQLLHDTNCRIVMAAFAISPDEVPGYSHLSKGSNNQELSEGNNEYKLEAHRDVGIRPLLSHLQDFLNFSILPLIDEEVAKYCTVKFYGLEAEGPEKERTALSEESDIHLTYDEILNKVEKTPIGKEWGGDFPLNPRIQQIIDRYFTVGQVLEHWFGVKDASKDPKWAYPRDPFFFQNMQLVMQQQQMEEQKQMAEQQAQAQQQQQAQAQQAQQKDTGQGGSSHKEIADHADKVMGHVLKNENNK